MSRSVSFERVAARTILGARRPARGRRGGAFEYPFGVTVEMWQQDLRKLVEQGWEAS